MTCALEAEWLISLDKKTKAVFLATLMHALTIAGRNSYRVQTEELDKPSQLRIINEVQHHVSACLRDMLSAKAKDYVQNEHSSW